MAEKKVLVVKNEQHSLFPDQVRLLNEKFGEGSWKELLVPASGWTKDQQLEELEKAGDTTTMVFASPLPLMLKESASSGRETFVFHNDRREKKELPNGKIISVVAESGWEIL